MRGSENIVRRCTLTALHRTNLIGFIANPGKLLADPREIRDSLRDVYNYCSQIFTMQNRDSEWLANFECAKFGILKDVNVRNISGGFAKRCQQSNNCNICLDYICRLLRVLMRQFSVSMQICLLIHFCLTCSDMLNNLCCPLQLLYIT